MTTSPMTFTNPIYHDGPLAQAITAFYQQQEQARIQYEETRAAIKKETAENIASLVLVAKKRFHPFWPLIEPYITRYECSYVDELYITVKMPEIWPFRIRQQRGGWTRISFLNSMTNGDSDFDANQPIATEEIARCLLEGHNYWREVEERRQKYQQKQANQLAYAQAFTAYEKEYADILTRNQTTLASLQAKYLTTFPVWKLTYGITAHSDEEGEFYADTQSVWVLDPEPDEEGFFSTVAFGKVTYRKFYSLVYLDGPIAITTDPNDSHSLCGQIAIPGTNKPLCFAPSKQASKVEAEVMNWVADNITPLPQSPSWEDYGLEERPDGYDIERWKKELSRETEASDEPAF